MVLVPVTGIPGVCWLSQTREKSIFLPFIAAILIAAWKLLVCQFLLRNNQRGDSPLHLKLIDFQSIQAYLMTQEASHSTRVAEHSMSHFPAINSSLQATYHRC